MNQYLQKRVLVADNYKVAFKMHRIYESFYTGCITKENEVIENHLGLKSLW